jgi:hypothetical protein
LLLKVAKQWLLLKFVLACLPSHQNEAVSRWWRLSQEAFSGGMRRTHKSVIDALGHILCNRVSRCNPELKEARSTGPALLLLPGSDPIHQELWFTTSCTLERSKGFLCRSSAVKRSLTNSDGVFR